MEDHQKDLAFFGSEQFAIHGKRCREFTFIFINHFLGKCNRTAQECGQKTFSGPARVNHTSVLSQFHTGLREGGETGHMIIEKKHTDALEFSFQPRRIVTLHNRRSRQKMTFMTGQIKGCTVCVSHLIRSWIYDT